MLHCCLQFWLAGDYISYIVVRVPQLRSSVQVSAHFAACCDSARFRILTAARTGLSDQSINPGQYNLTFEFSEANFIANDTLADHAFTVDWAMEFDVTDSLASFFLHGADFNFTAVELYPTNAPSVCLCGRGCLETPCSKIVVPKR